MDGHNSDDDIYPEVVDESDEEDESSFKRARTFGTHACVYISASVLPVEQSPANNHSNDVDPLLLFSEASLTVLFQARRVPGTKHSSHVQCVPIRARNCSPGLRLSGTTTRKSAWRFTLSSRLGREMRGDELPVVVTVCIFLAAGRYASRLDYGRLVTCVGVFCGRCVHEPYADWCGVG